MFNSFRKRYTKSNNKHHTTLLPSRYTEEDNDDDKYKYKASAAPSGALYGGCYYPTTPSRQSRRKRVYEFAFKYGCMFFAFVCCYMTITNIIGRSNHENLDVIGGYELTPIEVMRAQEAELQQRNANQPRFTAEQLAGLRKMVPEWDAAVGKTQDENDVDVDVDVEKELDDVDDTAAESGDGHDDVSETISLDNTNTAQSDTTEDHHAHVPDTRIRQADEPVQAEEQKQEEQQQLRTIHTMNTSHECPELLSTTMSSTGPSVSLVMQSTADRLWLLEETCKRWKDPIVLVVYIHNDEGKGDDNKPWLDVFDWNEKCPQVTILPYFSSGSEEAWQYPVNKLRNIGLDALQTTHFMVVDVDFVPSETLNRSIHDNFSSLQDHRDALVVPAFERKPDEQHRCDSIAECQELLREDSDFIPSDFNHLRECVRKEECIVFQSDVNWEGHYTTRSDAWLRGEWYEHGGNNSENEKQPRKIDCFHTFRYEPYVVLRWCKGSTPYYDERFVGYGKNKIEYISHMRFIGYEFAVLPNGFIVHHPHPESNAKESWNNNQNNMHENMDRLYYKFLDELERKHGEPELSMCPR